MFWQEKETKKAYEVPDDFVDLSFRMNCKCVPLDHAWAFSQAIRHALPWIEDEPGAGIHLIHGAQTGNGWFRPENPETELLHLSRRTRMTLRLPRHRIDDARALTGRTLDIDGHDLTIGDASIKLFTSLDTIFARYVVTDRELTEEEFLQQQLKTIAELDIKVRKVLCGLSHEIKTPDGPIHARTLMLAELQPTESVRLQQQGLGPHRLMGCGLFIAHKGIAAVKQSSDD